MDYFTNINRSAAGLMVACSLALGGPANQAADAPAAACAPSALAKGTGVPEGESAHPREQSAQQALEVLEVLQTAESLDPLDSEKRLACLARAARRFPANEDVARNLFCALGPKPQILSAEFDSVDGHIVRMVTQDTVVRTDAKLAPIPDGVPHSGTAAPRAGRAPGPARAHSRARRGIWRERLSLPPVA